MGGQARQAEEAGVSGVCRASNRRPEAKIAWAVVSTRLRIAWAVRAGLWPRLCGALHGRGRRWSGGAHHFIIARYRAYEYGDNIKRERHFLFFWVRGAPRPEPSAQPGRAASVA